MMYSKKFPILLIALLFPLFAVSCQKDTQPSIPKNIQARLDLANSYLNKNKPRRSLQELSSISENADHIPKYHFSMGMTYLQLDKNDKASRYFRNAVEIKPDYGEAWNNLGRSYIEAGKIEKAKGAYKKALEIETYLTPEYPAYNLARLYNREKKYEQALKYAKTSIKNNWRYVPAYHLISQIFTKREKLEKANKWLNRGAEANPEAVGLLLELGKNYLRLGNKEDAKYWFKNIKKLNPQSEAAQVATDYLETLQSRVSNKQ